MVLAAANKIAQGEVSQALSSIVLFRNIYVLPYASQVNPSFLM
jgi:hypothetical protein